MPPSQFTIHWLTEPNIGWLCENVLLLYSQCSQSVVAPFFSIQPQPGKSGWVTI